MKKFVVAVALFAAVTGAAVVATSALAYPPICIETPTHTCP